MLALIVSERGPPGPLSVVLSEAKDLIAACKRHEILRFAQDDRVDLEACAPQDYFHSSISGPDLPCTGSISGSGTFATLVTALACSISPGRFWSSEPFSG